MTRPAEATRWRGDVDWTKVRRVLVVKLRSIGDTVLATPTLIALRRHLPDARIDILLEDWVAPVLDGFDAVDNILTVSRKSTTERIRAARRIRANSYDLVFNLHGGTTATFFVRASGAGIRVGFSTYTYGFLYTHLLSSSAEFWKAEKTHSAEQQLALSGFIGVPVGDRPRTRLAVTDDAVRSLAEKLERAGVGMDEKIAMIHPAAAFDSKAWPTENFARVAEHLSASGMVVVAVGTEKEHRYLDSLKGSSKTPVFGLDDLSLPETSALAARSRVFVGNDSGIGHMAAAVGTPCVIVFGSSNIAHWRPWTDAPNEIVFEPFECQPCAGYKCEKFDEPKCILAVRPDSVVEAIDRVLAASAIPAT